MNKKDYSLVWERTYPFIFAAISVIVFYILKLKVLGIHVSVKLPEGFELVSQTLVLSGILLGFLSTSQAILISLDQKSIMKNLKDSGYIKELSSYLSQAVWLNLFFCIVCILGFFVTSQERANGYWFPALWIVFFVMALLSFYRITNITLKIFRLGSGGK